MAKMDIFIRPEPNLESRWTPKFVGGGPTLLHLHSGLTAQSVTNGERWTSIHENPPLS
jgi:hypothetical protein